MPLVVVVVHITPIQKNTVNLVFEKDLTLVWAMIVYTQLMYPVL